MVPVSNRPECIINLMVVIKRILHAAVSQILAEIWHHGFQWYIMLHPQVHPLNYKCMSQTVHSWLMVTSMGIRSHIPCCIEPLIDYTYRKKIILFPCREEPFGSVIKEVRHCIVIADAGFLQIV